MQARLLVILSVTSAFAFGLFAGPRPASADVNFHPYIKASASDSAVNKDPINVLYTINGTLSNAMTHFLHHVGWYDTGGSTMYFRDHGVWQAHSDQRASWCGACERDHMRVNQQDDAGPAGYDTFTMGPAHYEQVSWCGHVSVSYNAARDRIVNAMQGGGHSVAWVYWGNNQVITQCDGIGTVGDGWLVRIETP